MQSLFGGTGVRVSTAFVMSSLFESQSSRFRAHSSTFFRGGALLALPLIRMLFFEFTTGSCLFCMCTNRSIDLGLHTINYHLTHQEVLGFVCTCAKSSSNLFTCATGSWIYMCMCQGFLDLQEVLAFMCTCAKRFLDSYVHVPIIHPSINTEDRRCIPRMRW